MESAQESKRRIYGAARGDNMRLPTEVGVPGAGSYAGSFGCGLASRRLRNLFNHTRGAALRCAQVQTHIKISAAKREPSPAPPPREEKTEKRRPLQIEIKMTLIPLESPHPDPARAGRGSWTPEFGCTKYVPRGRWFNHQWTRINTKRDRSVETKAAGYVVGPGSGLDVMFDSGWSG
jgi:hypothetical protein